MFRFLQNHLQATDNQRDVHGLHWPEDGFVKPKQVAKKQMYDSYVKDGKNILMNIR
jgi:hypothetical protein